MKIETTIKNILILLVVGLGIFLVVRNYEPTPIIPEQQIQEVLVSEATIKDDFLIGSEVSKGLESRGFVYSAGFKYNDQISVNLFTDNLKHAVFMVSNNSSIRSDESRVYDSLEIDISSYCTDTDCEKQNLQPHTYCIKNNERIVAVVPENTQKVYAAWRIDSDTHKFVALSDLGGIHCYYSSPRD